MLALTDSMVWCQVSTKFVSENAEALAAKEQARIKPKTYQAPVSLGNETAHNTSCVPQEYNKWDAFDVDAQLKALDERVTP